MKRGTKTQLKKLAEQYMSESPLKSESTREGLSEIAAGLLIHYRELLAEKLAGTGNAEETRTLPSVASNYKRIMDALGLTREMHDPTDEEL